jgi:hypothetical protein
VLTFAVVIIEDEGGKSLAMYDLIKEFNNQHVHITKKLYIQLHAESISCTQAKPG